MGVIQCGCISTSIVYLYFLYLGGVSWVWSIAKIFSKNILAKTFRNCLEIFSCIHILLLLLLFIIINVKIIGSLPILFITKFL